MAKRLRHAAEAAVAWLLLTLLGLLPLSWASASAGAVARLIGPRLGVSARARRNLAQVFPQLGAREIEIIIGDMWENIGRVAGELPHLDKFFLAKGAEELARSGAIEVVGAGHLLDPAVQLAFAGHIGNWELVPLASRLLGRECHVVYRAANNIHVDRMIDELRKVSSASTVPKGSRGARDIIKLLRRGELVGMLVDQKMNEGIALPFLGRKAMTAPALAQLALRYDLTLLPSLCQRLDGPRFRITFEEPLVLVNSGDKDADVAAAMTRVNARLEDWITVRPGQWLWLHRRWPD
jgi:KDO2-lipid IV(A) lauroyltransferase